MNLRDILTAFEANLELERELGTRTFDCDRALLQPLAPTVAATPVPAAPKREEPPVSAAATVRAEAAQAPVSIPAAPPTKSAPEVAFISFRPLSAEGRDLLDKMIAAMGLAPAEAVVCAYTDIAKTRSMPDVRMHILLGADALKAILPSAPVKRGVFYRLGRTDVLCTMSPDFMLRFHKSDPAKLREDKTIAWADLKMAVAKLGRTLPKR